MISNYLKNAVRNSARNKFFSLVNVFGLAVAIASSFIIYNYIVRETHYDDFHTKRDRIYRVESQFYENGELTDDWASSSFGYGSAMLNEIPGIEGMVRVGLHEMEQVVKYKELKLAESKIAYTEPAFFDLFDFPLVQGDPRDALARPNTVVLSEKAAERLLGGDKASGTIIRIASGETFVDCEVTGIMKDMPANSHLQLDYLISYETLPNWIREFWYKHSAYTYILLEEGTDPGTIEKAFPSLAERYKTAAALKEKTWAVQLNPLRDIHLSPSKMYERETKGSKLSLVGLGIMGGLILLSAWINQINLTVSKGADRIKELAIRKVIGASRVELVKQFLAEIWLINIIAILLSLIVVIIAQPLIRSWTGMENGLGSFVRPSTLLILLIFFIGNSLVSILSAWMLSSGRAVSLLKGEIGAYIGKKHTWQSAMTIFQFAACLILVSVVLLVQKQINFMQQQTADKGMSQTIAIKYPVVDGQLRERVNAFKERIADHPAIEHAALGGAVPGMEVGMSASNKLVGQDDSSNQLYEMLAVDYDYMETLGLHLVAGRAFKKGFGNDDRQIMINEASLSKLGFSQPQDAIGQKILLEGEREPAEIIGVVQNWHQRGLATAHSPIMFLMHDRISWIPPRYLIVKVKPQELDATMNMLASEWKSSFQESNLDAFFIDGYFERQYASHKHFARIMGLFSLVALLIALLGLAALANFSAGKKLKDIAIRKIYGAERRHIVYLFAREFLKTAAIAATIAIPVSTLAMQQWLNGFAFRTTISVWIYVLGIVSLVGISLVTIILQSWKVIVQNPAKILKEE